MREVSDLLPHVLWYGSWTIPVSRSHIEFLREHHDCEDQSDKDVGSAIRLGDFERSWIDEYLAALYSAWDELNA